MIRTEVTYKIMNEIIPIGHFDLSYNMFICGYCQWFEETKGKCSKIEQRVLWSNDSCDKFVEYLPGSTVYQRTDTHILTTAFTQDLLE